MITTTLEDLQIIKQNLKTALVGHFNARQTVWNYPIPSTVGNPLVSHILDLGLIAYPPVTPTRTDLRTLTQSNFDIVITRGVDVLNQQTLNYLGSDYLLTVFEISTKIKGYTPGEIRDYRKTDWVSSRKDLNSKRNIQKPTNCDSNS